ncbi:All trans-polyprenyl-diphosphate synthase PDSS1 [Caenorhabditis elegans]|uniref:All trans-polyprenyl-diphosphate synthase PDSS1 n=1 Tax=Caenorhabditis elegans TaxID=6239 RepID=P91093_CAEEL|nr:Decaprenyl-diphosphate synthase subunit 2 [Caenorhabditis elegans]CCD65428.1 Decaprenyl-diphosphate synthase subunit 2 [Caenorhabditis elegans]|eukprot:NP_491588.1 COenzyme Q (ubiquinone) biosynthesis [Caenorhabditis elegans]
MGVLPKINIVARQFRKCSMAATSTSTSSSDNSVASTAFVQEHVRQMQNDIMVQLIPQDESGAVENLADLNVTSNLGRMTHYYFQQGGKMLRPTVSLLMGNACNSAANRSISEEYLAMLSTERSGIAAHLSVCQNQYKIGMIAEMIHTASLVHDDVIDEANTRRGSASVNAVWGNKMSVLVGDFILARATQILCSIGKPNIISVMASIIEDLVLGEFMQMSTTPTDATPVDRMKAYIEKTHRKTASLFASSCRSAAILADGSDLKLHEIAFEYGRNLGIAFQLADDLLDFIATADEMGKPVAADLKLGLATAPVLYACEQYPELNTMLLRKFKHDGDAEKAREIVVNSDGMDKTRRLIDSYSQKAVEMASSLPNRNESTEHLIKLAMSQSDRKF